MAYKDLIGKILKLFVFSIITLFIFIQLTYLYRGTLSHTRRNISGFYAEKKDSLDVVVIGTSSTFSAIMPMEMWAEYGIASYDMCTNVLLEDAIKFHVIEMEKTQHPQLLIIDTAPFLFGHTSSWAVNEEPYLRYNTDGFSISWNRINMIHSLIKQDDRMDYYVDLFYYHGNKPSMQYLFNKSINASKGYNDLPLRICYEEHTYITNPDMKELSGEHNIYFIELLEKLKDFDGSVLFIEEPLFYTQDLAETCSYSEYMECKIREYGYDYLDLSKVWEEIGIDSQFDYSLDYLHFNVYSAEKITKYLGEYINKNYDFQDHREDEAYKNWWNQYEQWEAIKNSQRVQADSERIACYIEADIQEYLRYLQSAYYSSCIFIPAGSTIWSDDVIVEQLVKNGSNIGDNVGENYFAVYDHSADQVVESKDGEKLGFGSTFGYVHYDNAGDVPKLFINGLEENYLEGDNGAIRIILVKKATGEIVDNVSYAYDIEQGIWLKNRNEERIKLSQEFNLPE